MASFWILLTFLPIFSAFGQCPPCICRQPQSFYKDHVEEYKPPEMMMNMHMRPPAYEAPPSYPPQQAYQAPGGYQDPPTPQQPYPSQGQSYPTQGQSYQPQGPSYPPTQYSNQGQPQGPNYFQPQGQAPTFNQGQPSTPVKPWAQNQPLAANQGQTFNSAPPPPVNPWQQNSQQSLPNQAPQGLWSPTQSQPVTTQGQAAPWQQNPGLQVNNQGPQANNQGPQANNQGPQANNQGPQVNNQGPQANFQGPQVNFQGPQVNVQGPQANNQGPQANNQGPQVNNQKPPVNVQAPPVNQWQQPLPNNQGPQASNQGPPLNQWQPGQPLQINQGQGPNLNVNQGQQINQQGNRGPPPSPQPVPPPTIPIAQPAPSQTPLSDLFITVHPKDINRFSKYFPSDMTFQPMTGIDHTVDAHDHSQVAPPNDISGCPQSLNHLGKYLISTKDSPNCPLFTYDEAQSFCFKRNLKAISVVSALPKAAKDEKMTLSLSFSQGYWTNGFITDPNKNQVLWDDGTVNTFTPDIWASGQPNGPKSGMANQIEFCVASKSGKLHDELCQSRLGVICEKKEDLTLMKLGSLGIGQ